MKAETQIYNRFSLSYDRLGFVLFNIYIFMTYVAHGVIISSVWTSYVMYLFLGVSALYMVSKKTIRISEMTLWQMSFIAIALISMTYLSSISNRKLVAKRIMADVYVNAKKLNRIKVKTVLDLYKRFGLEIF